MNRISAPTSWILGSVLISTLFSCLSPVSAAAPLTLAIEVKKGKLEGPGAEIIRNEMAKAQFILWGEEHGFADSAILLRVIAREARPLGFKYHVVEVGPLSTRMIRETLSRDGIPGLHKIVHEVPLGIPFLSLKDDAELASDFLGVDSKGTAFLWGIDQEFIGSSTFHLKRLSEIGADKNARTSAEKLLAEEKEAAAAGDQKKFLMTRFKEPDFDALAAQFKGQEEAQNIIAELRESAAIYQLWMSGHNYENNARRARLLARNFLADYKSAADPQPKIVFKMGLEHVALGTTTVNTLDIGTLVTSIAKVNAQTALRIAFLPAGGQNAAFAPKSGNPVTTAHYENHDVKEFYTNIGLNTADLPTEGWTVVPLEPIRQALDNKGIDALKPFSRFILLGYDYIIATPDAKAGVSLY